MKNKKMIFVFLLLFLVSGCSFLGFQASNDIVPNYNEEDVVIIPDEEFDYVPFSSLEEQIPSSEFTTNIYPEEELSVGGKIIEYLNKYGNSEKTTEDIGAIYFSTKYNTIYVSYKGEGTSEYLSSYDLYLIERHAIAYFISDPLRSEDLNYLRAVLIYADYSSGCGESSEGVINGCANYGGEYGIVNLNKLHNMNQFYSGVNGQEPKRDTFAHEYGHIATFYHMVYKGDESYKDYLKIRLTDGESEYFDLVYPEGMPNYSSGDDSYYIQPEEVLADDYVEMFYYTDQKYEGDRVNYTLKYVDHRNSLNRTHIPETITYLNKNLELKQKVRNYYMRNFYNVQRTLLDKPTVITKSELEIKYYDSIVVLNEASYLKTIVTTEVVKLIAVEIVVKDSVEYYRVILSTVLGLETPLSYSKRDAADNMGYVLKNNYTPKYDEVVYKVDKAKDQNGVIYTLGQNNFIPIEESEYVFVPYYDFGYVIKVYESQYSNVISMYDYLHPSVKEKVWFIVENLTPCT